LLPAAIQRKNESGMERREHPRMPITLPCEVEILRNGTLHKGVTRNISRTGALIELATPRGDFAHDDHVIVRIQLPARALFEQKCMTCCGVISRILDTGSMVNVFAVEIGAVQFESAERMLTRPHASSSEPASEASVH
jgi:hypothetical protein